MGHYEQEKVAIQKRIPNLDTFSTLIDRLSVENVKLATFEYRLEILSLDEETKRKELHFKIDTQKSIIDDIKEKLREEMARILIENDYDFYEEKRTFN